jgi:hypothetical protein
MLDVPGSDELAAYQRFVHLVMNDAESVKDDFMFAARHVMNEKGNQRAIYRFE